jgi:hypothetical protein
MSGFYETASSYWEGSSGFECVGPWSTTYLGRSQDVDYACTSTSDAPDDPAAHGR